MSFTFDTKEKLCICYTVFLNSLKDALLLRWGRWDWSLIVKKAIVNLAITFLHSSSSSLYGFLWLHNCFCHLLGNSLYISGCIFELLNNTIFYCPITSPMLNFHSCWVLFYLEVSAPRWPVFLNFNTLLPFKASL